jgi:proline iminopeptidase
MKYILILSFILICSLSLTAQKSKDSSYKAKLAAPGTKRIPVYNGRYKVFTQKAGSGRINLLLIHGGPMHSHEYFENFPENLNSHEIAVYFYDQLGSYYSDQPHDSSLWNTDRFVEEIEEVRKGLGLAEFYILGHGTGGLLAELYAQKYGRYLKGIILSNIPSFSLLPKDSQILQNVFDSLRTVVAKQAVALPYLAPYKAQIDSLQRGLHPARSSWSEKTGQRYIMAVDSLFERATHYNKPGTLPESYTRNKLHIKGRDKEIKAAFNQIRLPDYLQIIRNIEQPTLLLGARYDYLLGSGYDDLKESMTKTKVRVYICPTGSHFAMWDDPENYFRELNRFIQEVEANTFNPDN